MAPTTANEHHIIRALRKLPNPDSATTPSPRRSDYDLSPRVERCPTALTPAAVLVPLVARESDWYVLLTQRTQHLKSHPGQISFPGGRLEAQDAGPVAAALRETREEIGLDGQHIRLAGLLDEYETGTGFAVTPVVGFVSPGFTLTLQAFEVAEAFEVPLAFLLDKRNHQTRSRMHKGAKRRYYVFEYENRYIWGATAAMIMNLYERMHPKRG